MNGKQLHDVKVIKGLRFAHSGRGMTLNAIQNRYSIVNANSVVRRYMSVSQFNYCGVDLFGPCNVKDGRKERKRYNAIFTGLASRAIHLQSDSFIYALRRFIARRGPVGQIRSDQGTIIMGAEKEVKKDLAISLPSLPCRLAY